MLDGVIRTMQQQATTCVAANAGRGGLDIQQTVQGIVLHMSYCTTTTTCTSLLHRRHQTQVLSW